MREAATHYDVPLIIVRAVRHAENGRVETVEEARHNTNGTRDYGPMQINSIWVEELRKKGASITAEQLAGDYCTNVWVGVWRLADEIEDAGSLWKGVGNYHSRTEHLHKRQIRRVWEWVKRLRGNSQP